MKSNNTQQSIEASRGAGITLNHGFTPGASYYLSIDDCPQFLCPLASKEHPLCHLKDSKTYTLHLYTDSLPVNRY